MFKLSFLLKNATPNMDFSSAKNLNFYREIIKFRDFVFMMQNIFSFVNCNFYKRK